MPKHGYSVEVEEEISAKAMGRELHISPKDSVEICQEIKGMMLPQAQEYLRSVIRKEKSVPYNRHGKKRAHRKGKGVDAGGYPVKAAKEILGVLENAENNAEYKGLSPDNSRVVHASAKKGIKFEGFTPRAFGRASPSNTPTTNIEIVVREG
ncbi:MAG: 50S ribosomal protein L22 [Candidatus Hadarchaeia archaeon]